MIFHAAVHVKWRHATYFTATKKQRNDGNKNNEITKSTGYSEQVDLVGM